MTIERVRILKTLKAGLEVWEKGQEYSAPIPRILLQEIAEKTGTVMVVAETAKTEATTTPAEKFEATVGEGSASEKAEEHEEEKINPEPVPFVPKVKEKVKRSKVI